MLFDSYPFLRYASLIIYALCSVSSYCLTLAIEVLIMLTIGKAGRGKGIETN